jgi:hypothetical protein
VTIDLPVTQYPEFVELDFACRLYQLVEKYWNPKRGLVSSEEFRDLTYAKKKTIASIGWLTYATYPELLNALPPDVRQIPCANGALVVTSEELSSPDNPKHVAQAMRLRDILQKPLS